MQCELCGKVTELVVAMVEGTQLNVCANCGRFGKVLTRTPQAAPRKAQQARTVPVEQVVADYASRIRTAREKRGLTQEEFAKIIQVKESLLHKMETGNFEPPLDTARKLERILHINLVEVQQETENATGAKESKPAGLTIGDILKR